MHTWLRRYANEGLAGLQDRSHRCAHQASPEVEALVCELRRQHPRWGSRRIAFEPGRHGCAGEVPSRMAVDRIPDPARADDAGEASPRPARTTSGGNGDRSMELWQMDIVGGLFLADGRKPRWSPAWTIARRRP